jgi:hypothetical protein
MIKLVTPNGDAPSSSLLEQNKDKAHWLLCLVLLDDLRNLLYDTPTLNSLAVDKMMTFQKPSSCA